MQKFILLRGHEGSGKSTFAQEKIAQFQQTYPQAEIHLIDNDIALTNEHGEYHFDSLICRRPSTKRSTPTTSPAKWQNAA